MVHWGLGAQEGKIGAKTLYEVKGDGFYEVKGGGFYEVKGFGLHFGRFFGRKFGRFFGRFFGKLFGKLFGRFGRIFGSWKQPKPNGRRGQKPNGRIGQEGLYKKKDESRMDFSAVKNSRNRTEKED